MALKTEHNGSASSVESDFVQFARLALSGRSQDIQLYIRRMAKRYQSSLPKLSDALTALLLEAPTRSSPLRREAATAIPVDMDSRLKLLRHETAPAVDVEPVFRTGIANALNQIIEERHNGERLLRAGLAPTKSILFTGPPGVGKSLAAHWLAMKLHLPLLTLDLSAVMSSFLGRTGNNIRYVLDHAKSVDCVLLLDEFDAVAKRRDDSTEIGELKRLVTVLLQEIDDWPATGLLVAATNHASLLDPAVWRRFELKVDFPLPTRAEAKNAIKQWAGGVNGDLLDALAILFEGKSFSEMERYIMLARRAATMKNEPVAEHLKSAMKDLASELPRKERGELATKLVVSGQVSQREAHNLTGVSRDTIRKSQRN
jgi:SpoVK/Ycf46/Vps4 family AAA+-type ATPase